MSDVACSARYLTFAQAEWDREVRSDFARLRMIPSSHARFAAAALAQMPVPQREELLECLLRRFHPQTLGRTHPGVQLDNPVLAAFDALRRANPWRPPVPRVGRPLLAALKRDLSNRPGLVWDSKMARYTREISPGVSLVTYVGTGGRYTQVYYMQRLVQDTEVLLEGISLLAWLGLSGQTSVDVVESDTMEAAARLLSDLVEYPVPVFTGWFSSVSGRA